MLGLKIIIFFDLILINIHISVDELGIKELMPAYLDPNLQAEDLKTGVSFASGACGYDPLTAISAVNIISFLILRFFFLTSGSKDIYIIKSFENKQHLSGLYLRK